MKASELMIGDWVQGYLPDTYSKVVGIISELRVGVYAGTTYMELSIEDIQPILLTPEILERNGFTNEGYFAKLVAGEYVVICDCSNVAVLQNDEMKMDIPIKYVHELQHALKLCGIEKEITL